MADEVTSRGKNYSIIAVLGMFSFLTALSGTKVAVSSVHKRASGSYYFETADGRYLTANKNYVQ